MPETDHSFMRGGLCNVRLRACVGTTDVGVGNKPDPQFCVIHAGGVGGVTLAAA
jgi:hypothetical protein